MSRPDNTVWLFTKHILDTIDCFFLIMYDFLNVVEF